MVTMTLVGRAQTFTQAGWYRASYIKPLPADNTGTVGLKLQRLQRQEVRHFSHWGCQLQQLSPKPSRRKFRRWHGAWKMIRSRIFDYVHDHIRHVLYFGSKKGAELTLFERSGNDFDQCALLVALLQAAGYSRAGYQFGW